jgi:hypothetical protein
MVLPFSDFRHHGYSLFQSIKVHTPTMIQCTAFGSIEFIFSAYYHGVVVGCYVALKIEAGHRDVSDNSGRCMTVILWCQDVLSDHGSFVVIAYVYVKQIERTIRCKANLDAHSTCSCCVNRTEQKQSLLIT